MQLRKTFAGIFVAAGLLAVTVAAAWAQKEVGFPNAGVHLTKPQGFVASKSFDGFEQASTGASVMVIHIPGPFAEVTRGFTADNFQELGMTLRRRQNVRVGGKPGILLSATQYEQEKFFEKWIVAIGDPSHTVLVTASFPQRRASELSARLKAVVLSVRKDKTLKPPSADAGLPFIITPSAKMKQAKGIGKMLLYTKDGVVPTKAPADPLFVVAPSMGSALVGNRGDFARKRLLQMDQTTDIQITAHQPVRVNGLDGFESLATGKDAKSGTPLRLYQTLLFDGESYIVMQGLVGSEQSAVYLGDFKGMARSLRRK
ncbi:MAG: hypothetical protein V4671_16510 [Armatimonadota bacterium]